MKVFIILLGLLFAIQVSAQRTEPVSSAERNQLSIDPMQLQGPPPPIDTMAPVLICGAGQDAVVSITGSISICSAVPLSFLSDNVTPNDALKKAIRKAGTGTGFPLDANGNPITEITYNCQELGLQLMEIWAMDEAGNASFCITDVSVWDIYDYCNQSYDSVLLCVKRHCDDSPIPGIPYSANGTVNFVPGFNFCQVPTVTDSAGCGVIYISEGTSVTVAVEIDDNPRNGLTTLDLLLIAKHIMGLQPFTDPYRLIAADANKSGSVTSFDIIEFQKLIKGLYTELPNNTSWRFIDADFQFPNPFNPFMTAFPEVISLPDFGGFPDTIQFYGIKIGDVNCSANLDSLYDPDYPDVNLIIKDTLLQAGQEYEMPIYLEGTDPWAGYQFALDFDSAKFQVTGIVATQWTNAGDWSLYPGRMATSWLYVPHPVDFGPNQPISIVRIKAIQTLALSEVLSLSSTSLHAEAYLGLDAVPYDLVLTFPPHVKAPELPVADKNNPGPDPTQLVDQAPPVLDCYSGFTVYMKPTNDVELWVWDFLGSVRDNSTPPGLIDVAIRKAGTGSGFPEDTLGTPVGNILFTCLEQGTQTVEVWARDLAGNTSVCQSNIIVYDINSYCSNKPWNVAFRIKTEMDEGIEVPIYVITGNNPNDSFYVNEVGYPYSEGYFDVATGSNITASIIKNDNPLNGVTTYDKVLINRHILGLEPLDSPYKIIAADADNNGVVDTMDILEIDKLILGEYTDFPNNTSWRFVPKDFVFPEPANPFATAFPENMMVQNLQIPVILEFVAIKVGDVNNSAVANLSDPSSEDRGLSNQSPLIGNAYPNPTPIGAVIPMELHANAWVSCSVYTMQGRQVWMNESELPAGVHSLDIPAEAFAHPGMYLWYVRAGDTVKTGKIVAK